jgi:hypothetical protein
MFPFLTTLCFLKLLQPLKLSSTLGDETLEQMKHMKLSSGASFISFQVLAIARYAGDLLPSNAHGLLHIPTHHHAALLKSSHKTADEMLPPPQKPAAATAAWW